MKWGFCFLLFAGVSLLLAAEDMEVTGSRVNIRQSPSTRGTVIGSVKAGERVKVKEVKNGWAALEDRPGFVFASFLRKAGAVPDPVKPAPPKPAKPAVVTQTAPGQIFADLPVEAGSKRDVTVKGLLFPLKKSKGRVAYALLKAVGGYNMNMPYAKPCVWSDSIEMFSLRQGYQLHRDQGLETRLTAWAEELGKEILEVESSMAQLKMLTGFSDDLQLWMLESTLETDAREYWEDTMDLYEKWCTGDEAALREVLANEWDTTEMTEEEVAKYTPLMEEYTKAMDFDRNEGMLDVAIEYLESGDVIFYAVGLAHLLDGTNGLVDALRAAGYTVEPVTYGN